MNFLSPIFFWGFLSLIPLAAIYFLKVRPRRRPTTAYFLWEQVLSEKRTSSLFSRLRDLLSLLLMILAFSAVVLALTRPELASDERKDLLIMVDRSASMSAREGGVTRLEKALDQARRIVRGMNGTQRAAIAGVAATVDFHSHLTDNPRDLFEALDEIGPSELALDLRALEALLAGKDNTWAASHRLLLLTDGCLGEGSLPGPIEAVKVGEARDNLGLVAADMQLLPGRTGLYYQLASSERGRVEADLLLKNAEGGEIVRVIPVSVRPGVNPPETLVLDGSREGRWILELDHPDALDADNRAYLAARAAPPIDVAVSSRDPFFLENSVMAFSQTGGLLRLVSENPHLVIAGGEAVEAPMALVFQPGAGESPWWENAGGEVDVVLPKIEIPGHPVLQLIDLAAIPFVGARRLRAPEDALVIASAEDGLPLLYQVRRAGRSVVVVNMDPLASEFYYSAYFPVFVHSVATYLAGREEELAAVYRTGETAPAPGIRGEEATRVRAPGGAEFEIAGKFYGPLADTGFHRLSNDTGDWDVACSLLSPADSLLDNSAFEGKAEGLSKGWSPAFLLTLLAVAVLVFESVLYHRRKVG